MVAVPATWQQSKGSNPLRHTASCLGIQGHSSRKEVTCASAQRSTCPFPLASLVSLPDALVLRRWSQLQRANSWTQVLLLLPKHKFAICSPTHHLLTLSLAKHLPLTPGLLSFSTEWKRQIKVLSVSTRHLLSQVKLCLPQPQKHGWSASCAASFLSLQERGQS